MSNVLNHLWYVDFSKMFLLGQPCQDMLQLTYLLTNLLTYLFTYLLTYLLIRQHLLVPIEPIEIII